MQPYGIIRFCPRHHIVCFIVTAFHPQSAITSIVATGESMSFMTTRFIWNCHSGRWPGVTGTQHPSLVLDTTNTSIVDLCWSPSNHMEEPNTQGKRPPILHPFSTSQIRGLLPCSAAAQNHCVHMQCSQPCHHHAANAAFDERSVVELHFSQAALESRWISHFLLLQIPSA